MKMYRKGQSAIEYMVIFGFSLAALGVLWYYTGAEIDSTRWDLQLAYAKSALNKIVSASETVYIHGPPSQLYVYPNFPDNVRGIYKMHGALTMELAWKDGVLRNVSLATIANITLNVTASPGVHRLLVKSGPGYVEVRNG